MKRATFAPVYLSIYPMLAERARACGYAGAIHGSVGATPGSDLDFLCAPWSDEAVSPDELIGELVAYLTGVSLFHPPLCEPEAKPHGRLAWSIILGNGAVIDVSVMPRKEA